MSLPSFPVVIVESGGGGGTTAGTTDIQVSNNNTVDFDGSGFNAPMALGLIGDDGIAAIQGLRFINLGGLTETTEYRIDVGGGASKAAIAAKIKAAVDMGPLADLVETEIVTTEDEDDTVRITALGLGAGGTITVHTPSAGLTVTVTPGS